MRQRYLLGRYNFLKYQSLFSDGLDVTMESTDVYRTLQSGYSELLGMVHQQNKTALKIDKSISVPFKARRADSVEFPEEAFVPIPIYTFIDFSVDDDLQGCQYSTLVSDVKTPLDSTYRDVMYTKSELV
jgi:hypothetical protein